MTISKDLFLSILAMDAYNRGYGEGIRELGGIGAKVGSAEILRQSDTEAGTAGVNASFYALSYTITDDGVDGLDEGTQVLSFRGTDYYNNPDDPFLQRVRDGTADLFQGWSLGGGMENAGQAQLTIDFFESAVLGGDPDKSIFDATYEFEGSELRLTESAGQNVVTTGHSLGGGLAGFAAMLSGAKGVGFDHMPFGVGALAATFTELQRRIDESGANVDVYFDGTELTTSAEEVLKDFGIYIPDYDTFKGISVADEINAGLRDGTIAATIGAALSGALLAFGRPFLAAVAGGLGYNVARGQIDAEAQIEQEILEYAPWNPPGVLFFEDVTLHSPALLVMLQYEKEREARTGVPEYWRSESVMQPLFDG